MNLLIPVLHGLRWQRSPWHFAQPRTFSLPLWMSEADGGHSAEIHVESRHQDQFAGQWSKELSWNYKDKEFYLSYFIVLWLRMWFNYYSNAVYCSQGQGKSNIPTLRYLMIFVWKIISQGFWVHWLAGQLSGVRRSERSSTELTAMAVARSAFLRSGMVWYWLLR